MQSKKTKTTGRHSESIKPAPKQKKRYSPPKFMILTADQARSQLTQKALPGESATSQLLAATNERRSIPDKAKTAPGK
jgi:hypothetical protein